MRIWYYLGYACKALRDLDGAIKIYRRAVDKNPIDFVVWDRLGNAYEARTTGTE